MTQKADIFVRAMSGVLDSEMETQLESVRKELLTRSAEEYPDSTKARNQLVNGLSQRRDTANRLASQDATNWCSASAKWDAGSSLWRYSCMGAVRSGDGLPFFRRFARVVGGNYAVRPIGRLPALDHCLSVRSPVPVAEESGGKLPKKSGLPEIESILASPWENS